MVTLITHLPVPWADLVEKISDACPGEDAVVEVTVIECLWCGKWIEKRQENQKTCGRNYCRQNAKRSGLSRPA